MNATPPIDRTTKKHICIDFEGEGCKKDKSVPQPALLGAFVPNLHKPGKRFET